MAMLKVTTRSAYSGFLLTLLFLLLAAISTRTRVNYPGELAGVMTSLLQRSFWPECSSRISWCRVAVVAALGNGPYGVSRLH